MATMANRMVLEGVPRVSFFDGGPSCPEDIPFPSVMRALMEYFHEGDFGCRSRHAIKPGCKITCSYAFFIGVSGVASFLSWKPGWAEDNLEISYMSDDPREPFDRAFQATGYEYEIVGNGADRDDEMLRRRIMESIQKGKPVLAFGPIGPPEATLVTGYDEGGDVLIGWSFFQHFPPFDAGVQYEPSGQFRKRDWLNYPPGLSCIVIGDKKPMPPMSKTYRRALEWMVQVARTPATRGGRHNGIAAYEAWSDQLLRDDDFPNDETVLRQHHEVHNSVVGMLAEARWYGSLFLIQASDPSISHYGMAEDLLHSAACFAAVHDLMWQLWDQVGGNGNPDAWRYFADPTVRRRMVPIIQQAREKDAQGIEYISQALARA